MGYRSTNTIFVTAGPIEAGPQAPGQGTVAFPLVGTATQKKVVAVTGRCSVALVGYLASKRTAPQSGVAALSLSPQADYGTAEASGSFTHITVTRDYRLATNEPPIGVVYFTPSAWMVNNGVTIPAAPVAAPVSSEGLIQLDLAANNDAGTTPADAYYEVREQIVGQVTRIYKVVVPYNAGSPVDLAALPVLP